jgi:predicted DsbA family dithiol-disulfide isomerase
MIVDFVHDLVCPWCRIGLANLRAAAALRSDDPPTIRFRPYQLNPGMPEKGVDYRTYLKQISGGADPAQVNERVTKAGEAAGVTFQFDRIQRAPNSLMAHALVAAAPDADRGTLIDALHRAYFDEGRDIGDRDTLLAIAGETGIDAKAMGAALSYPEFRKMVGDLADQIRKDGVQGVPFFVFNDLVALSGAYPPAQLVQAMTKAAELAAERDARQPVTEVTPAAETPAATAPETVAEAPVEAPIESGVK